MTVAAVFLTLLFAAWMAWRGYRRGAAGTLAGWLPFLAFSAVLAIGLWIALLIVAYLVIICIVSLLAAAAALAICYWLVRRYVRRALAPRGPGEPRRRLFVLLAALNHFGGAFLGLVAAALIALGLAALGGTVTLAFTLAPPDAMDPAVPTPKWVEQLGRACSAVADVATFGVLDCVPRLGDYAREVRALVVILRAPRPKLRELARRHGFDQLADLPEIQAALADGAYLDLLARAGAGDLGAIQSLARHPATRRILACPQVRRLASSLTPTQLAAELSALPAVASRP